MSTPVTIFFTKKRPFEQALALALVGKDQGQPPCYLHGRLKDIVPPADAVGVSLNAWQGACLVYCASNQIEVVLLAKPKRPQPGDVDIQKAAMDVSQATCLLADRVRQERSRIVRQTRAERTGYVCGRPPYGYRVESGEFAIDPKQRDAVEFIFNQVRRDASLSELLRSMLLLFPDHGPVKGRPQFWDRVKIKRILSHARLYCLGEYTGGRINTPITIPALAFLPAAWADTSPQSRPSARKATT